MNARLHRVSLSFHCAEQDSGRERVQPEAATTKNPDKAGVSVKSNVSGSSVRTLGRHQHVRQPSVRQPSGGRYDCAQAAADSEEDCSALIRALRRLLCRAALFWWINPRADMRSRIGCAALSASRAASASLLLSAFTTFLTAVRSIERWATLRALRAMVCLARFCADLILATAWNLSGRCRKWIVARWIENWRMESGQIESEPNGSRPNRSKPNGSGPNIPRFDVRTWRHGGCLSPGENKRKSMCDSETCVNSPHGRSDRAGHACAMVPVAALECCWSVYGRLASVSALPPLGSELRA